LVKRVVNLIHEANNNMAVKHQTSVEEDPNELTSKAYELDGLNSITETSNVDTMIGSLPQAFMPVITETSNVDTMIGSLPQSFMPVEEVISRAELEESELELLQESFRPQY
jgi:hypothetical protein